MGYSCLNALDFSGIFFVPACGTTEPQSSSAFAVPRLFRLVRRSLSLHPLSRILILRNGMAGQNTTLPAAWTLAIFAENEDPT